MDKFVSMELEEALTLELELEPVPIPEVGLELIPEVVTVAMSPRHVPVI